MVKMTTYRSNSRQRLKATDWYSMKRETPTLTSALQLALKHVLNKNLYQLSDNGRHINLQNIHKILKLKIINSYVSRIRCTQDKLANYV